MNWKKIGIHLLKVIVAGGILWFVYSKLDGEKIKENFSEVSIIVFVFTLFLLALSKLFSSIRLTYFIRDLGVNISQWTNWKLYLLGMFYNLFLPGGVGGDGYKIYYLNKHSNLKTKDSFWPFLLDRISGMFSLVIITLVFSLMIKIKFFPYQDILAVALIVVGFIFCSVTLKLVKPMYLKTFFKTLHWSFLVQLTQVVCIFLFLKDIGIIEKHLEYFQLFVVSSIASIIPITPGGSGLRELTYKYGAEFLGTVESTGVFLGTLFFLITLIVSFGGIYYHFKGIQKD